MDIFSYLRNPIVLGILSAVLVYLYLYWEADKKHKKNPKIKKKSPSFITPAVVGVIIWFISSSFLSKPTTIHKVESTVVDKQKNNLINDLSDAKVDTSNGIHTKSVNSNSIADSNSFYLIGKNKLGLPTTDVFIDIARF